MSSTEWKKSKEVGKLAKKKPSKDFSNVGKIDLEVNFESETLTVVVKRLENLKKMDMLSQADPYVYVYLIKDTTDNILVEKGHEKTAAKSNEKNPNFMEEFRFKGFDTASLQNYSVCAAVYDKDTFSADDYIGGVRFALSIFGFRGGMRESFMIDLQTYATDGHPREVGVNQLHGYSGGRGSTVSPPAPAPIKKMSRKKSTKLSGSITIKVDYEQTSSVGFLRVFVDRCSNLKDTDFIGKGDPYVKVYVLDSSLTRETFGDKQKTRTINGNLNPVFEEYFEFKITERTVRDSFLVLEVYDDDVGKDDIIGGIMFSMRSLDFRQSTNVTLDIFLFKRGTRPKEAMIQVQTALVGTAGTSSSSSSSSSESEPEPEPPRPVPIKKEWHIHNCNDMFAKYISTMQILTDAFLTRKQIPEKVDIHEWNKSSTSHSIVIGEIPSFKVRLEEARRRRDRLTQENTSLKNELNHISSEVTTRVKGLAVLRSRYAEILQRITVLKMEVGFHLPQRIPGVVIPHVDIVGRNTRFEMAEWQSVHGRNEQYSTTKDFFVRDVVRVSDRMRDSLIEQLSVVRRNFQPHIENMEQYIRQLMIKVEDGYNAIAGRRLYHPDMGRIIDAYEIDIREVDTDITKIRAHIDQIEREIQMQSDEFLQRKEALNLQFKELYARFYEELKGKAAAYGANADVYLRDRLEVAIYRKLIEFEEHRISEAMAGRVSRATVDYATIPLDASRTSFSSTSRSPIMSRRTVETVRESHSSTYRAGGNSYISSQGATRVAGSVNTNFDGRRISSQINTAGSMFNTGGITRGAMNTNLPRQSVTSDYETTSPGPLSPDNQYPPIHENLPNTPGSPPGIPRRGFSTNSNISDVFMKAKHDMN